MNILFIIVLIVLGIRLYFKFRIPKPYLPDMEDIVTDIVTQYEANKRKSHAEKKERTIPATSKEIQPIH